MSKSSTIVRTLGKIVRVVPAVLAIIITVPMAGIAWREGGKQLGLKTIPVPVVGTGSMYPSLFWSKDEGGPEDPSKQVVEEYRSTPHLYLRFKGINIGGKTYLKRQIGAGDMVAFKNAKTTSILQAENKDTSAGFIKRIVGIPGDTIELRDGFVYKNGNLLEEPYIYNPRSTYGGESIKECVKISVGQNQYLVLGDNRKVSSDSRSELGLISEDDIEFVLPYSEQSLYRSLWRDTSKDEELLGQATLSAQEFVSLLNKVRSDKKVQSLKLSSALAKSSSTRGNYLLEDPQTSYNMERAISSAGYSNKVLGEFVSYGRFSAKELLENLLYRSESASQVLGKDFSDIGLTAVNKEINGCPTQVIVGHMGGYIPATYDQETIESWRDLAKSLRQTIPTWEQAQEYEGIDQDKLGELLAILRRRLDLADEIVRTMENREWITTSQESRIQYDATEARNAEALANELNKQ